MAKKLTVDWIPVVITFSALIWFSFEVGWKAGLALFILVAANGMETKWKKPMAKKREWKAWMVRGGERELSEIAYGTRKAAMLGISHAKHWTLTKPLKVIRVRIVEA